MTAKPERKPRASDMSALGKPEWQFQQRTFPTTFPQRRLAANGDS